MIKNAYSFNEGDAVNWPDKENTKYGFVSANYRFVNAHYRIKVIALDNSVWLVEAKNISFTE